MAAAAMPGSAAASASANATMAARRGFILVVVVADVFSH
jgi:hypothetical protein